MEIDSSITDATEEGGQVADTAVRSTKSTNSSIWYHVTRAAGRAAALEQIVVRSTSLTGCLAGAGGTS